MQKVGAGDSGNMACSIPRFSLNVENEQAKVGRDGQTFFARPNNQTLTGTGEKHFPCSSDREQDW